MNREALLQRATDRGERWDIVIIGGGATGLGTALDAATRGYRTLLLERGDLACGTSSRSTKLIHGGIRYLRQGNVSLVMESLRERELLMQNAPGLVKPCAFVIPAYRWWERPYYRAGLKIYGLLAGGALPRPRHLSRAQVLERIPTLQQDGLRSGELYHDAQFDDARLAIALAQSTVAHDGVVLNYLRVDALLKHGGRVCGVRTVDVETGEGHEIEARVVINATGVFADSVRHLDDPRTAALIAPSQGAHIVLPASFLPGETALMVPRTDDGRVLFAIPWLGRVIIGTTDTPVRAIEREPRPLATEIDFLLAHAARYLAKAPGRGDILSTFAGLRPLVRSPGTKATSSLARDHLIEISPAGLVTITGGKWTTFRNMGERTVNAAAKTGGLDSRPCTTRTRRLDTPASAPRDAPLHPRLPYCEADVRAAARLEMARTVADVLARRTRSLFLDAKASIEIAPRVAALLAAELGRDAAWEREQVRLFAELASGYCAPG